MLDFTISLQDEFVRIDFHKDPTVDMVLRIQQLVSIGYPSRRRLYCLNKARFLFTLPELKLVAENALSYPHPPDRVAIVTDHAVSYETARIHKHYRTHPDTEEGIFRTEADAIAWLSRHNGHSDSGEFATG